MSHIAASPSKQTSIVGAVTPALDPITAQKQEWATKMRLMFTPKDMLNEDGSLNEEYFKPKGPVKFNIKKWTEKEEELLISGIEKYGIGEWAAIRDEFLKEWAENELRLKAARVMGRQSLKLYKGWKGNREAIQREYEKNKAIGMRLNMWKGGVLVNDNAGEVEKAIREYEEAEAVAE